MREKERKYCYGMYTLMFLLMCMAAFLPFFMGGKSRGWLKPAFFCIGILWRIAPGVC